MADLEDKYTSEEKQSELADTSIENSVVETQNTHSNSTEDATNTISEKSNTATEISEDENAPKDKPIDIDSLWAEKLGMHYDPERVKPPLPPADATTPPALEPLIKPLPPKESIYSQLKSRQAKSQPEFKETQPQNEWGMTHIPQKPKAYLAWAVISAVFFSLIPGIVAIYFSTQVSTRWYARNFAGSERASYLAQCWIIASIVLGIVPATIFGILTIFGA